MASHKASTEYTTSQSLQQTKRKLLTNREPTQQYNAYDLLASEKLDALNFAILKKHADHRSYDARCQMFLAKVVRAPLDYDHHVHVAEQTE
jgi:hypothetical protein